ncbi:hypothetical protein [Bacteroides thetaiotaomicron]|uniref:hypothetical protein n=1 Tax=Bacteroides thetaiotaomicron TaxID=818 RepID=UPI00374FB5CA
MLRNTPNWTKYHSGSKKKLIMRIMGSHEFCFQIDYSFLKKDISQERKKEILHLLQNTVSRIQRFIQYRKRLFILCS